MKFQTVGEIFYNDLKLYAKNENMSVGLLSRIFSKDTEVKLEIEKCAMHRVTRDT